MTTSIESQLEESYRDALVAYYLGEVVPKHELLRSLGLSNRLKTANDLYEFFLLDNQVSYQVQTSYVASAIASLQQYINGALMGMEPGYDKLIPNEARYLEWRDRSSQYPIWAANQQLALYPEIYISPDLRLKKSTFFSQLENDINQNKIHIDTTQDAVKAYLASFEEVANLTILNGYIDSDRFAEGTYYFIGKSRAENIYYWRTVDMNERAYLEGTQGAKHDNPTPGAWSDWTKANIGITANTLERTIRPVYFNHRLFVTWVDLIYVTEELTLDLDLPTAEPPYPPPSLSENSTTLIRTPKVQLLFNMSYKKYDNSWSAPQIYMDVTTANKVGTNIELDRDLNTIAVFDISKSPESLFIALYAGATEAQGKQTFTYVETAFVDKNFNVTRGFPYPDSTFHSTIAAGEQLNEDEMRVKKLCTVFGLKNKDNFQFTFSAFPSFKTVTTTSPPGSDWNYQGDQSKISDITKTVTAPTLDIINSTIRLTSTLSGVFEQYPSLPPLTLKLYTYLIDGLYHTNTMQLHFDSDVDLSSEWITLDSRSSVTLKKGDTLAKCAWTFANGSTVMDFIITDSDSDKYMTSVSGSGDINFEGKRIRTSAAIALAQSQGLDKNGLQLGWWIFADEGLGLPLGFPMEVTTDDEEAEPIVDFCHIIGRPDNMNAPTDSIVNIKQGTAKTSISAPDPLIYDIAFDKSSLRPLIPGITFIEDSPRFYISHGIEMRKKGTNTVLGRASKLVEIELELASEAGEDPLSPKISTRSDPLLGIAEYIDFSASKISKNDAGNADRLPIRMNTLFARELINKANIALEALLSWNTQLLNEPAIGNETAPPPMDFKGANGLYFWELFLHLPFLVAHRLNLEQQFNDAETWLAFIFDPGRKAAEGGTDAPDYWNVRPIMDPDPDPDYFMRAPIDPDGIAASEPVRYRKAVYSLYIKNLIDRGDYAYRQLTPDSIGEAKLWYVRVLDLLGPRPDTQLVSQWTPVKLSELASSTSAGLREFENRLAMQTRQVRDSANANNGKALIRYQEPELRLATCGRDPTVLEEDNAYFIPPMNSELVKHWDTLDSRLYNLRHNFTLDGKPMSLPLFAAPLDPRALLAAYANGATGGGAGGLLAQEIPHYRYAVMFGRASAAVETLIQFGNTLLSIIERKEQNELAELQQQQAWEFAQYAIDLQKQTQRVEIEARKALEASRAIVDARAKFYLKLSDEGVSPGEIAAAVTLVAARIAEGVAATASAVAAGMKPIPNQVGIEAGAIGGMSVGAEAGASGGGHRLEGIPEIAAILAHAGAIADASTGTALDRSEGFRRRAQEWQNAYEQATLESEHIAAQLAVHNAQIRVTALQLRQAEDARAQAEVLYAFLKKRFTSSQLYQWLNGQFATFYYQAYDATLALCQAAQSCWQYEIGDYAISFIKPGAWKDTYRGLAAGEALKLDLLRMDAAYLTRNERKLEVTKTVSIRQLPVSTDDNLTLNPGWDLVVERLEEEGIVEFEITQAMLDADYPDHYLRRIKRLSVSLPVTVGPYQDIRATLSQTYNAVQMTTAADAPLKENMRASQQIAISSGVDDDGLFTFNFDDERYLPFEGTGVISRWTLAFPNHESQKATIESITDIIVHIRYTARDRGVSPTLRITR
jgi:hypothetical protein